MPNGQIVEYYDHLATTYDNDRFGNYYGRFIDRRERQIIPTMLPVGASQILDLGCGTGRLSNFATHGCDGSSASLTIAAQRHPRVLFRQADVSELPYDNGAFDAVFCFHVFMHLDPVVIRASMTEAARILRPGGVFIADIASSLRRGLLMRSTSGWHGGTSLRRRQFADIANGAGLQLTDCKGLILAPIHRLPSRLRSSIEGFDHFLAAGVPELSSYMICKFERRI